MLLRICVAGMLWTQGHLLEDLLSPVACASFLAILALLLCLGAFTPINGALALITQFVVIARSGDSVSLEAVVHTGITACLVLLGPGAYSVDARLYGRRIILSDSNRFQD